MFKDKDPGGKAFDRCAVKTVLFTDRVYIKGIGGPRVVTDNLAEDSRTYADSAAVLSCPRTEDPRVTVESTYIAHRNKFADLAELRQFAGTLMCATCRFSSMSPAEVSNDLAETAVAEAEAARAQANLFQATLARTLALQELQASTGQPYLGIIGSDPNS